MLLTPWARFCDASLEAEYQQEKRQRLAQADSESGRRGGQRGGSCPRGAAHAWCGASLASRPRQAGKRDVSPPSTHAPPRAVRSAVAFVLLWAYDVWR